MSAPYRDPEWLRRRYHGDDLTQCEIAEECGVSPRTIRKWMKRHGIETREIAGENHPLLGKERSEETKEKISNALEGREFSEETRSKISETQRGRSLPETVRSKISRSLLGVSRSEETREMMSRSTAGKNNPNWNGGYSRRYGAGWAVARERVQRRDEICQFCGDDGTERSLEVHHIVPVRRFREVERASIEDAHRESNLVLLCSRCHARADHGSIEVGPRISVKIDEGRTR